MNWKPFALAAAAVALPVPVQAGDELLLAPPAAWVVARPPAPEIAAEPDLPVALLALDSQVRHDGGRQDIYTSSSLKILAPQGLSAGDLAFTWRPETEDLTVHRVLIRRGGETIDVLESGQSFTVLRREQNLEQAMLDGTLTAQLFPDGLQVGDILEVATTTTVRNPVTGDHAEILIGPLNLVLGRADVTLSWREGQPMRLDRSADLPQWNRSKKGGFEYAELRLEDLKPVLPPRGAPARFGLVRLGQASDYASWGEVSRIFAPLYAEASQIPADGPLRNEVEKIRAASDDPLTRAEMALDLVQGRVRYVALLSGLGGLVPAPAADTWTRRYGDCKAKTALLMGILAELGIASEPVLVNTVLGQILDQRLPAAGLFDHLILRATIGGRDYWLDGTRTGDSSLARLEIPYFEWGLPIRAGEAELVRLVPEPPALPLEDFAIEFDAREGLYDKVPARLELVYRGDAAIGLNMALGQMAGAQRDRALRDFWRGRMHFVEADTVEAKFDPASGEYRLTLAGTATMDWDDGWYATDYTRVGYRADFSRDPGPGRDAPFAVAYPNHERTRQTILLPPSFTSEAVHGDAEVDEMVAGRRYYRRATLEDGRFHIERSEQSLAPEFAASEAPAAQRRLRELYDKRVHLRLPDGYRATEGDIAAVSDGAGGVDALVNVGRSLLDQDRYEAALEMFVKATEADPKDEWGWANRAIAHASMGDFASAEEAAARAEAIAPNNFVLWNARGLVAARKGEHEAAVAAFSRSLEQNPDNVWPLTQRIEAYFGLERFEDGLADARRLQELEPDGFYGEMMVASALLRLGQTAEGEERVNKLVEKFADDPQAQMTMAGVFFRHMEHGVRATSDSSPSALTAAALTAQAARREVGETDLRLAELTRALEINPTYIPALVSRANLYWMEYKFRQAIADADAAIALAPRIYDAYHTKAKALADLGRPADAAKVAAALVEIAPSDPLALVYAAQIYTLIGYRTKARETIVRAREAAPDHPFVMAIYEDIVPGPRR